MVLLLLMLHCPMLVRPWVAFLPLLLLPRLQIGLSWTGHIRAAVHACVIHRYHS